MQGEVAIDQMPSVKGLAGLINDRPGELFFQTEDGRIVEVGSWAHDLVRIGRMFACADCEPPLTLALSLPTLDFAGSFIAAGFIAQRLERRPHSGAGPASRAPERAQLFRQLCGLPTETPVLFRLKSGNTVHAVFQSVETFAGELWAVIRFQNEAKGAGREFINEAKVHQVIFVVGLDDEATDEVIGKTANARLGLAEGFLSDDFGLRELILRSAEECAIVGIMKTVSEELCDAKFRACQVEGRHANGTLQDIVRAANFVRPNEFSRSSLFSIRAGASEVAQCRPGLAIFCGSSAYLNQAAKFSAAHHAALLSPIEHNFDAAVASLNDAYLRKLEEVPDDSWTVPEGVVAMGFRRHPVASQ